MTRLAATLAFGMPSTGEWVVLLVVGLLIFGRRLPEVGRSVAKTVAQFRRGLQDFKREMDKDEDLKEVKSTVTEFKKAVDAPRILANPGKFLDSIDLDDDEETEPPDEAARTKETAQGVEGEEKT